MRRTVTSAYVSLDGIIENPQRWSLDYFNDEAGKYATEQLFASDALLMGRRTYDVFASSWPTRRGDAFSDRMNSMSKYVVSSTMEKAEWNNTRSSAAMSRPRFPSSSDSPVRTS